MSGFFCFFLYAVFLIKNVPFKRIEINHNSNDITITYEGHFLLFESFNKIEEFLTDLSPNMDAQRLKNESKRRWTS